MVLGLDAAAAAAAAATIQEELELDITELLDELPPPLALVDNFGVEYGAAL